MDRTQFENLAVYQLAERLSDEVWQIARGWAGFEKYTVGKQVVRAADSIGANIAEGVGRGSYLDNQRFVRIARGSLNETKHWLRRAFKRGLLDDGQVATLKPLIDELAALKRLPQINRPILQTPSAKRRAQRTTDN